MQKILAFTLVYRTSQDKMAVWHRCYKPRVHRSSNRHLLLLRPSPSLTHYQRMLGISTHRIVTVWRFLQAEIGFCQLVTPTDNHFVQEHRLPFGSAAVARKTVRPWRLKNQRAVQRPRQVWLQTLMKPSWCKFPLRTSRHSQKTRD